MEGLIKEKCVCKVLRRLDFVIHIAVASTYSVLNKCLWDGETDFNV